MIAIPPTDERLLLDLLNSTPVLEGREQDELQDRDGGRRWLAARDQPDADEELGALIELRPLLQDVVRGVQPPRVLAPFVADVSYRAELADEGVAWILDAPSGRSAAARAVLAWDAVRLTGPGRLRACENPECQLFLIDRSKPNNARWCSMATCGNRMKARRHYQRSRDTAAR